MSGFSVVIPTLNEERHLGPLLSDVAAQTMSPDQVLVVDAGSDDATVTVAGASPSSRSLRRSRPWPWAGTRAGG
ncbi:MAG TPA: glycosyltransferase [Rubrobacteraceae bacterium]|nr:glycosyltransferase [Rubrobacteraceae bacterium]